MTKPTTLACFALAAVGYGVAAWAGAALAWDGAWYLWRTVHDGRPFIAHGRWANGPALGAVLGASRLAGPVPWGPWGLARLDGALLALVPLGSLGVCWRVWRGRWEPLRVWAALGILLVPLPGQWALMSEATLVAQLGWPLLALAGAGRRGGWTALGMTVLAAAAWGFHPSAAGCFALGAGVLAWRRWWSAAVVGATLAVARAGWTVWEATPYERAEVSLGRVWAQWQTAVWGLPALMLTGTGLLAVTLWLHVRGRVGEGPARGIVTALGVGMALVGVAWGLDAHRWGGALDFRRWVLPVTWPFLALAGWHGRRLARAPAGDEDGALGRRASLWAAGVFAATLLAQSWAWSSLLSRWSQRLREPAVGATAAAPGGRVFLFAADDLPWLRGTALEHWTGCPLSLWLGRDHPGGVFVLRREDLREGGAAVQVTPWDRLALPPTSSSSTAPP